MAAVLTDLDTGARFELVTGPHNDASAFYGEPCFRFRINRRASADVRLTGPWISKHHGGIDYRGGKWWVNDGGSINTVTVNGEPITADREIASGDVLGFGQTRLLFEIEE